MKIRPITILPIVLLYLSTGINAQQKYKSTIVTKLGEKYNGYISVNLNGPNNELVEIETSEKTKTKQGGKRRSQTTTTQMKLNIAIISYFIINDTTYYFRDIKYDYKEKYFMNSCVRLLQGTLDCGLFQTGNTNDLSKIAVKLPNGEFSQLISTEFDYYKATSGWTIMAFGSCPELKSKMVSGQAGYKWDDNTAQEQRLAMWKKWIQEFNACKK